MAKDKPNQQSVHALVRNGVVSILTVFALLVFASLWLGRQMDGQLYWTDHTHAVRTLLSDIERDMVRAESSQRAFVHYGKDEALAVFQEVGQVQARLDELQKEISDNPPQIERTSKLRSAVDTKLAFMNRAIGLKRQGKETELRSLILSNAGAHAQQTIHNLVAEMYAVEAHLLVLRRKAVAQTQLGLRWTLGLGFLVALLVALTILRQLSRRLAPLAPAALFAERIGRGDLTSEPLPVENPDEMGRVSASLNAMLHNLRREAEQNQSYADTLNSATARLAAVTKEQAVALQQQSTALQQTSVTLEELGQSARSIADRALEVAARAEETTQAANSGLEAVRKSSVSNQALVQQVEMVASRITSLNDKTDAIRNIVLSVNDIAERSTVLALNAAILSAAAGSEGKSFTVVANEMKSLADQSKESTVLVRDLLGEVERGITSSALLIEEASRRSAEGTVFTDSTAISIQQLRAQVMDGSSAFQQIVAATHQQRLAFDQVQEALLSIHQATQQSSSTIRELESTTSELHGMSGELLQSLEKYGLIKNN